MSTTQTLTTEQERATLPEGTARFAYGARTLLFMRVAAGVMALPFAAALVLRSTGLLAFVALLLAASTALLLVHVHRRVAKRPAFIALTDDGIAIDGRGDLLRWSDVTHMHHSIARASVRLGTRRDAAALTVDADLTGYVAFIDSAARRIEAARRPDQSGTDAHGARPVAADTLFHRSLLTDAAGLAATLAGVLLGLIVHPGWFALAAAALPALVWHWLSAPRSVAVDDTAVWIIRPLRREAVPLRAIRDIRFAVTGRTLRAALIVDHRDRGPITIDGFGADALPMYDAVAAARVRMQAAVRTGPPAQRRGSAMRRADSRNRIMLRAAAVIAVLIATAWATVLTGTPLRTATRLGNVFLARTALLLGSPLESAGGDGMTALHIAAAGGHERIARALLRDGADTGARTTIEGLTPLHIAAARGHGDLAAQLVAAGADANARNAAGRSPLAHAVTAGSAGDTAVAALLVGAGADVALADQEGRTALHHAALNGHAPFVRVLARAGALEVADHAGQRALHAAAAAGRQDVIEVLIAAGADVNAKGSEGRTALAAAVAAGAPVALANLLLEKGAGAAIADDNGWNAVQLAARANNLEMLELFARRRSPLNATDGRVPPPLWLAAESGRTDAARALLRGGASPYVRWDGRTAIDVARANRNATLVALMQMR